ncbi:hypothetical protein B7494_g3980 [Chlorociboria aeruginascens]|nr:hypothetical protein B7494_g3980 [Chlorociboria aeruginascens]
MFTDAFHGTFCTKRLCAPKSPWYKITPFKSWFNQPTPPFRIVEMTFTFTTFTGTATGPVVSKTITRPALTGHQLFVKTTHSGVCGTDLLYRHAGIGLGHEGAGIVQEIGPQVTNHKVGDRVAWGWVNGSCGECAACQEGYIAVCQNAPNQYGDSNLDQGSYSTGAVWDSRFVYRIPDSMASEDVAPILCGGWTVWNALVGYNLKPTDHVGVIGIGGLGHFAIQMANKMGCEVTAFSGTESKKADAISLGAHHFVATKIPKGEKLTLARPVNHLLICTNAHIDWDLFTPILAGRATVFPLQIPHDMSAPLMIPHMPFLMKSINVVYSTNGRHDSYDKLLAFSALHGIKPVSEKLPMTVEGIEQSFEKLLNGEMRYRGVLVADA